ARKTRSIDGERGRPGRSIGRERRKFADLQGRRIWPSAKVDVPHSSPMRCCAQRARRVMKRQGKDLRIRHGIQSAQRRPSQTTIRGEEGANICADVQRIVSRVVGINRQGVNGDVRELRPSPADVYPRGCCPSRAVYGFVDMTGWARSERGARSES